MMNNNNLKDRIIAFAGMKPFFYYGTVLLKGDMEGLRLRWNYIAITDGLQRGYSFSWRGVLSFDFFNKISY